MEKKNGTKGMGHTGETKYGAENAPVIQNGGNDAIHNGVVTEQSPYKTSAPNTSEGIPGAKGKGMGSRY